MKQILLVSMVVVGLVGGVLWLFGSAIYSLWEEWATSREVKQIQHQSSARREQRRQESEQRLANGCEHSFLEGHGEFPPGVCTKCGLAKEKPSGPCDHVWRAQPGGVPRSSCEKCGKVYSSPVMGGGGL